MREKKSASPSPLTEILPHVFKKLEKERPSEEKIREIWKRLAGREASEHSWPRQVRRGWLLVEVESSGWMHALRLRREWLLRGLVEMMGAARVRGLRFRMGERADA